MANYLKEASQERYVFGIDISHQRILVAKSSIGKRTCISFVVEDITNLNKVEYNSNKNRPRVYILSQVLYLFPEELAIQIIHKLGQLLNSRDILYIIDYSRHPRFKYFFLKLINIIITIIFKFGYVLSPFFPEIYKLVNKAFGFRSQLARIPNEYQWNKILNQAELNYRLKKINNFTIYPQIIFKCTQKC